MSPIGPIGLIGLMPTKKIAILIAQQDFRDEEYFIPKSIFEERGIEVVTASQEKGEAIGAFGGVVEADISFDDLRAGDFECLIFVGGAGAMRDLNNKTCYEIAKEAVAKNKILGAICIAAAILAKAGVLKGKKATVWSSNMDKSAVKMLKQGGAIYQEQNVVVDGNLVTADGPGAARKFAEAIAGLLQLDKI